ncbi:PREDICTED: uncharacterized protein LOC109127707 [Camelina sativa]|uniref:Uncharacterized protein LOC109127707 n=1 Tax=Camelina sativa TaxID=90675 RepID=A0ABM1QP93_CAMSA|nr:PREDICTED: uncharacterized protein LOC109127707 [Camelina sativa]
MADIAILVAEEYERRMRHPAGSKSAPAEFDWKKITPAKMAVAIDKMKIESLKNNFETKSHFALAISHGFFSA